jgi:signal transduction histidine kinase
MPQQITPLKILLGAFPGIPQREAQELVISGTVHTYPPNTVLCQEDAYEATFYIILDGEVKVTKILAHDQVRPLKTLVAGDFFGEMAIIHNAPRAATVTTVIPTTVLEIRKDAFNSLLRRSASISLAMVKEVSYRLRENDAMAIEDLRMKAGELAAAYQQLAEQDFARREFISMVANELRTPLTAANGFLQMMQMGALQGDGATSPEQKTALESVARNIQQIVSLVNDILFMQEMDLIMPRFEPVDIAEIITTVATKSAENAKNNQVELDIKIDELLPKVNGDEKSLERAVSAIVDNAIKFSPDGGSVSILAEHTASQVRLEVQDHGIGIPADVLPRIFDRFFHIDQIEGRVFRGMGLGLSIARQVIEQYNGKISVESEYGKGTLLTIVLPAAE